jgi:hypothetical protein
LYVGAGVLGLIVLTLLVVLIFYGTIGAAVIHSKVVPRLEAALGRKVKIGNVDVRRGHAALADIEIAGPKPGDAPLAKTARVNVEFAFWPSLRGKAEVRSIEVKGLDLSLEEQADGSSNYGDIVKRIQERRRKSGGGGGGGGGSGLDWSRVRLVDGRIKLHDRAHGVTLLAYDVNVSSNADKEVTVETGEVAALTGFGPDVKFPRVSLKFAAQNPIQTAVLEVNRGQATLWSGMTLTGISGSARVKEGEEGRFTVDISGGYGDLAEKLWHLRGWLDPKAQIGDIELRADRFTFDKLAPVLAQNPHVIEYEKTSLDASVHLVVEPERATVDGDINISNLNLFHEKLAAAPVKNISVGGELHLIFDRIKRAIVVDTRATSGKARYLVHTEIDLPVETEDPATSKARRLRARMEVPALPCQDLLDSIPKDFIPDLKGFRLGGLFQANVAVNIDWADLEATTLEGGVGIKGCKVLDQPEHLSAKRLSQSFEHQAIVAVDPVTLENIFEPIVIGPENPDYVPIEQVSPYVVRAFLTTEDSSFYEHSGFITREFRTALIRNLQAGAFKFGASSITMQMIKNVFLRREKTLSRKFQELFLTWYIETQLEKDRIMEIYVNAIEYGPGLYGIGPAAGVYFNKHPIDITPVEAAFFASILPAPSRRFAQFCKDRLSNASENKVARILGYMFERDRLTAEEYTLAQATPLTFATDKAPLCSQKGGYYEFKKKRPGDKRKPIMIPLPPDEENLDDELEALDGD